MFLKNNNINYERFDHPAVFTCEDAQRLCPAMPGEEIKNLFIYDKRSEHLFLVVVGANKRVDLKKLKEMLGTSNLSFCSEERLKKYLGVEPGSVTILGLVYDVEHEVSVIFDEQLNGRSLQCHPLINTSTLVIKVQDIERFLRATGHSYQYLGIPERLQVF